MTPLRVPASSIRSPVPRFRCSQRAARTPATWRSSPPMKSTTTWCSWPRPRPPWSASRSWPPLQFLCSYPLSCRRPLVQGRMRWSSSIDRGVSRYACYLRYCCDTVTVKPSSRRRVHAAEQPQTANAGVRIEVPAARRSIAGAEQSPGSYQPAKGLHSTVMSTKWS